MFSSLVPIPVVALLKYFEIIDKKASPMEGETSNIIEGGGSISRKKNTTKKSKHLYEMTPLHRPLHAVESNATSIGTELESF